MSKRPLEGPRNAIYWHILQTSSAAEIAFNRAVRMFPRSAWSEIWAKKPNESEKTIFYSGYRNVHYKSGHEPDNLRAETLHGAIIDELREQDPTLFPLIILPMLGRYSGWCDLYTSPNGFDHTYDQHQKALQDPDWEVIRAPSTEAWWWTPEQIEMAKRNMSEAQFAQEIMAEFRDLTTGKAYLTAGQHNVEESNPFGHGEKSMWCPYLPIIVGMDFNVNPMIWHLGQYRTDRIWWGDSITLENTNTHECAQELVERVKDHALGVVLIGDATGKSKNTKSRGSSDYDIIHSILTDNKIKWEDRTPESNPPVKDRVNTMNAAMRSADGTVAWTYSRKRCPALGRDLDRVVWKKGASFVLDKTTDASLTHASDSVGYPTCVLMPIKGVNQVGRMRVITRSW